MTFEERFETIENALVQVVKIQGKQAESLDQITQTFSRYVDSADARMKRTEDNIESLTRTMRRYMDGADARMIRIEENLDVLIRAITAEHTNGKNEH